MLEWSKLMCFMQKWFKICIALFCYLFFFHKGLTRFLRIIKFSRQWSMDSMELCMRNWLQSIIISSFYSFPCYVIWRLCLTCNSMIFEDKNWTLDLLLAKILAADKEGSHPVWPPKLWMLKELVINLSMPWGKFDGAFQGRLILCGSGSIL